VILCQGLELRLVWCYRFVWLQRTALHLRLRAVAELGVGPKSMSVLDHTAVSLRVFSDDLKPDEVTALLGCAPTEAWQKDEVQSSRSGRTFTRRSGAWFLRVPVAEPEDFNGQVTRLFAQATDDLGAWKILCTKYEVDLFCGWFMSTSNDGVSVSVATLRTLTDRGVELSLDIYDAIKDDAKAQQTVQPDGPASDWPLG